MLARACCKVRNKNLDDVLSFSSSRAFARLLIVTSRKSAFHGRFNLPENNDTVVFTYFMTYRGHIVKRSTYYRVISRISSGKKEEKDRPLSVPLYGKIREKYDIAIHVTDDSVARRDTYSSFSTILQSSRSRVLFLPVSLLFALSLFLARAFETCRNRLRSEARGHVVCRGRGL